MERTLSTRPEPLDSVLTTRVTMPGPKPAGISGNRIRPMSSPPAVVAIRAAPTTLVPKSSGCRSASDITVIPPIE